MSWLENNQATIEHLINYQFKNPDLLTKAFTYKSMQHQQYQNDVANNEVLVLIGNWAFDLIVTKILTEYFNQNEKNSKWTKFKKIFTKNNSKKINIAQIKKDLMQTKSLAKIIDYLDWSKLLIISNEDYLQNIHHHQAIKENLLKALIGAVAVDCNYNLNTIEKVIKKLVNFNDYFKHYHSKDTDYLHMIKAWEVEHDIILVDFDNWQTESNGKTKNYYNTFWFFIPDVGDQVFAISNQNKTKAKQELAKQVYDCLNEYHLINQKL